MKHPVKMYPSTITIPVLVSYEYFPHHTGHHDSLGCPEEPDEPAHVEVDSVMLGDKELYPDLCKEAIEELELKLLEEIQSQSGY